MAALKLPDIDVSRQFTSPANLTDKRVISSEMGAVPLTAYRLTHSELLSLVNLAAVGGVNQMVFHGQTYSGNYYVTSWPRYRAFFYQFSEMYSDKQPSWDHGFGDLLNYTARVQYLQLSGVSRTDVAIYIRYIYSYLSPENFALPEARVHNGIFAPDGPAYRALLITGDNNMTLSGLYYIQKYALGGLTVILSVEDPGAYTHGNSDKSATQRAIQTLKSRNVPSVSAVQSNGTWYSTWRENSETGTDDAFVFCETNAGAIAHISASRVSQSLVLSNGDRKHLPSAEVASSNMLSDWILTAEHWEAQTPISLTLDPGRWNSSGLGYHTTQLTWPPTNGSADGAYLVLSPISHTARRYAKGKQLSPLDLTAPRADITAYLQKGSNDVSVVVPTTWNYARSIAGDVETVTVSLLGENGSDPPGPIQNDLIGDVKLVPYVKYQLGS
ncbi:hypothetical protein N7532_004713 [Penicillium argentinense]|uniref:Uncharacterized protein n=1 Tax=Penicillium argentinense TaxID=1131581 RepID=A0A9W9FPW1_9EURO|nr:uncharacterized protein N7532_004713 [Penicillium argentinense]KAJ5104184.1 hypothetical protein N7532_004713 [Penicillium argentinense]